MGVSSIPFREILCQNEDAKMKVTIPTEDAVFCQNDCEKEKWKTEDEKKRNLF